MKLFVLGGSGLIGKSLIKLNNEKYDIIATYNKNQINIPKTLSVKCSLPTDFNKLENTIITEKPNVIVNTMGYSNIDFCEMNKIDAHKLIYSILKDEIALKIHALEIHIE